jgi:hypothetical protein
MMKTEIKLETPKAPSLRMLLPHVKNIFSFIDDPLGYETFLNSQLQHDKDDGRSLLTRPINLYFLSYICDRFINNPVPKYYESAILHIIKDIQELTEPYWCNYHKPTPNQKIRYLTRIFFDLLRNFLEVLLISFSQILRDPNSQWFVDSYVALRGQMEKIFKKSIIEELCQEGSSIQKLTREDLRTLARAHGFLTIVLPLTIDQQGYIAEVIRSTISSINTFLNEIPTFTVVIPKEAQEN